MKSYTRILGSVFAGALVVKAMDGSVPGIGKGASHYQWERQIVPEQQLAPPVEQPPQPGQWVPPTTTSTIIWWPYTSTSSPPAYAVSDAVAPSNPPFIIPAPVPSEVPPPPAESTSTLPMATLSSTTCTQSDCSITSSLTSSSTFTQPSSSSSTESQSLIQITALPPASSSVTPSATPKMNPVSLNATSMPRTRVILICVSAGVGLLAGSVVAWFCFGFCMTRRRRKNGGFWKSRKNKVDLRAGPEYSQAWAEDLDHEKHIGQPFEQTEDMKSLHRASQSQSAFSWDIPTRPPARDSEQQSFLAPPGKISAKPSRSQTRKSARSAMRRNTTKSVYSTLTGYEASPDPMALLSEFEEHGNGHDDVAENEDEELIRDGRNGRQKPYESLRKGSKTIRRELLERVRQTSGSQVRRVDGPLDVDGGRKVSARRRVSRGHHRANSDVVIEDGRVTTQHSGQDSGYQAEAAGAHDEDDQTRWVEGSGFRIVEEEVKSMWGAVGEWASGARNTEAGTAAPQERKSIFSSWVGKSNEGADTYTPLPARSSPSKSQARVNRVAQSNGFGGRPERRDRDGDRPGLPRVDSSVLPRSPPQIMSPPLASQLFFTPQAPQEAFPRRGG